MSGRELTSERRPERGQRLRLAVDALAYGGEGIARYGPDGYVVFVAGAVPGDVVEALVYKRKRAYAHARATEVIEPSAERIEPLAQHPGVPWQVLPYERQLEVKRAQVDDALRRIGRLEGYELTPIVPALEQWRYRNKLEYSFGHDSAGGLVCGFHAPAGWNHVVHIEDCLLASQLSNRARSAALAWAREQRLSAWERAAVPSGRRGEEERSDGDGDEGADEAGPRPQTGRRGRHADRSQRVRPAPDGRARLRNLVVREGRRTGQLQVRLVTTPGELDVESLTAALLSELGAEALSGLLWTRSESLAESTGGGLTELVAGEPQLPERMCELDLRVSPEAFLQTNTEMAEVLYGIVARQAALQGFERVFDLYCGTGTIALCLASRAGELWGVDVVPEAIADAIAAAERNGVPGVRFYAGDTRLALPELLERAGRPDVLVVDPPRAGLSQRVVRRIVDAAPRRIVYVSCNPTTLAPNAAQLAEAGWALRAVTPVDMFPQTHHVECVACFDRAS
ncbi:MAG: 23S rRNA (uracil(1939)-C(5))-methyltransferase RlmD [Solirubrobacteraceae bacterium]